MIITFKDVGRCKDSWTQDLPLNAAAIAQAVKKKKVIASKAIDVDFDPDTGVGNIYVGGLRCVGVFTFTPPEMVSHAFTRPDYDDEREGNGAT